MKDQRCSYVMTSGQVKLGRYGKGTCPTVRSQSCHVALMQVKGGRVISRRARFLAPSNRNES